MIIPQVLGGNPVTAVDSSLFFRQAEAERLVDAVPLLEPWADERENRMVLFELHRSLLGLGGEPEDYENAIGRLAGRLGCDEFNQASLWEFFEADWEIIKWPKNRNWIREAYELALSEPVPFPAGVKVRSANIGILYGMCWHLSIHNAPAPFELSRRLLAEVFVVSTAAASTMVNRLVKHKLVQPLGKDGNPATSSHDEFYVATKRNKRYRLL